MKNSFVLLFIIVFMTSCAQKIEIQALKSAKVSDDSIKQIGIMAFESDDIEQSNQLNSVLSKLLINGQKYFNVIDRANIQKIMEEKKLNDSGLVDLISKDGSSGLQEIRTLVVGKVALNDMTNIRYFETRTDHGKCVESYTKDGKSYCSKYKTYNIICETNNYSVNTNVKFIRVKDAKTIFGNSYSKEAKYSHCKDDSNILPSKKEANTRLAGEIAKEIAKDVAPYYVSFSVTLLDDEDVKFTKEQSKKLRTALELIKAKRNDKANEILKILNDELMSQSYVVLYDLALTEEALGNIENANNLYIKAEQIAIAQNEVVKEISETVVRSKNNLIEFTIAKEQMKL